MAWLLDTNVVSELNRPRPDRRVISFLESKVDSLFISSVTLAEIRFGIERATDLESRDALQRWLDGTIRPMFRNRVLEISEDVMLRWRIIVETGRKSGWTYPEPDLLLAAIAVEHDLVLVTRNVRDFVQLELTVLNLWMDEE
jgi:predicted nucleic acid-binding protein